MLKNIGSADRVVRVVVGLAVIAVGLYTKSWWGAVGVPLLLTAAIGWCPAYLPFGITTCRTKP
jgi:hypothetical protein